MWKKYIAWFRTLLTKVFIYYRRILKNTYCHRSEFPLFHSCEKSRSDIFISYCYLSASIHRLPRIYTNFHEFQILFTRFRVLVTCFHFLFHQASVQTKTCEYSYCVLLFFGFPVEFLNKCTEFRLSLNLKWLEISFRQSET